MTNRNFPSANGNFTYFKIQPMEGGEETFAQISSEHMSAKMMFFKHNLLYLKHGNQISSNNTKKLFSLISVNDEINN